MGVKMKFSVEITILVLLLAPLSIAKLDADGKGFLGIETDDGVAVSQTAIKTLDSPLTKVFLPILYIVVFAVGLPTNAMAIWVFLFRTKKKHPAAIYMANLALSDLMFVIWIPLKIAYHFNGNHWIFGEELCKVMIGFFYGNMYCSILFITCISVQRYWAIVHPMSVQRRSNQIAIVVCITIWAVIWLATIPLYLYDQSVSVRNLGVVTCHDVNKPSQTKIPAGYFITMGTMCFIVPSIVCIVAYVLMLRALRSSMTDEHIGKKRRKAMVLIITVLVLFLVCFAPSNIMLLIHYSLLLGNNVNNGYGFYITTLCLASLNSCLDPFVYYFISEEFRENVKNTFLCRSNRTVERMRVSFSALKYSKKSNTYSSESGNTQSTNC